MKKEVEIYGFFWLIIMHLEITKSNLLATTQNTFAMILKCDLFLIKII